MLNLLKVGLKKNRVYLAPLAIILLVIGFSIVFWTYSNPIIEEDTETQIEYNYEVNMNSESRAVVNTSLYTQGKTYKNLNNYQTKAFPKNNITINFKENQSSELEKPSITVKYYLESTRKREKLWSKNYYNSSLLLGETKKATLNFHRINQKRNEIIQDTDRTTSIILTREITLKNRENKLETNTKEIVISNSFYELPEKSTKLTNTEQVIMDRETRLSNYFYFGGVLMLIGSIIIIILIFVGFLQISNKELWEYETYINSENIREVNYPIDKSHKKRFSFIELSNFSDMAYISQDTNQPLLYNKEMEIIFIIDSNIIYYITPESFN